MYFIDRVSLGKQLSDQVLHLHAKDSVIVCLKETSLLTCVAMGIRLRAWVYPLIYAPVHNPDDEHMTVGAITQDGDFCLNPDVSESEYEYIQQEFRGVMDDRQRIAMHEVNERLISYANGLDKHVMNGRDIILAGDVLTDPLHLAVARQVMKPLTPKSVVGLAGNVTVDVSDLFHLNADTSHILDVLPGTIFDDSHYFERADPYTADQMRALSLNIATYWE